MAAGIEVAALSPEVCRPLSQPSPGTCLPCGYAGRQRAVGGPGTAAARGTTTPGHADESRPILLRSHATPL